MLAASTNEHKEIKKTMSPERECTPNPQLAHSTNPPQAPHATPDTNPSYEHLIEIENLPNIGQYDRCKEHPNVWDINLKGLEISHFEPFHS